MDKFWKCEYSEYDELFDEETGEEWEYPSCNLGYDCDDCENCKFYKERVT